MEHLQSTTLVALLPPGRKQEDMVFTCGLNVAPKGYSIRGYYLRELPVCVAHVPDTTEVAVVELPNDAVVDWVVRPGNSIQFETDRCNIVAIHNVQPMLERTLSLPDMSDTTLKRALISAIIMKNQTMVEWVLPHVLPLTGKVLLAVLEAACHYNNTSVIKQLIVHDHSGSDLRARDMCHLSVIAAEKGHLEIMELLETQARATS